MKKWLLALVAFVTFFSFGGWMTQNEAQAQEVEFELLGKLGGGSSYLGNKSLGDTEFNVLGGLDLTVLCRFDLGIGIGLNFNWTMLSQRMDETKLNYALEMRDREFTLQHPSFGVAFRYLIKDIFDVGLWLNYGFGSAKIDYRKDNANGRSNGMNEKVAQAYGLIDSNNRRANLKWDLQSFEIGIVGAFAWRLPAVPELSILVGLQMFLDASRMIASDQTLAEAVDMKGEHLDENSETTLGIMLVFGARYDLRFGDE